MNKLSLYTTELLSRLCQGVVGGWLFDFPPLYQMRNLAYKHLFGSGEKITVGRECSFIRADFAYENRNLGKLVIGNKCAFNHHVEIDYSGGVVIEDEVWISQNTIIETHSHVISKGTKYLWPIRRTSLIIESGVWIGAGVIVTESVNRIGRNSIVAAGAVVTKDVQPHHIVAGVPAKTISIHENEQV